MPAENIVFQDDVLTASDGSSVRVEGSANVDYDNGSFNYSYKIYDLGGNLLVSGSQNASGGNPDAPGFTDGNGNYVLGAGNDFSVSYHVNQNQPGFTANPAQATFSFSGIGGKTYIGTGPVASQQIPVCFVTGTAIRTARGEVPVEALAVGDLAVTASGELRPIVWIGSKRMDCSTRAEVRPIRIRAGAFGVGDEGIVPARDLFLSPGHPVLVGEGEAAHLVPIMCLINGSTIERAPIGDVTYWHVELDRHDLLLAEGLAAESYLDWGDRPWFVNGADHALTNPDFVVPGLAGRCLPVAIDGPIVEAERGRLDAMFAAQLAAAAAWPNGDAVSL